MIEKNEKNEKKKKSSNKLRMKALVGWNTLYQVPELINLKEFFTRKKNDMDKEGKIVCKCNFWNVECLPEKNDLHVTQTDLYGT